MARAEPAVLKLSGGVVAHEIAWWRPGADEIVVRGHGARGGTVRGLYAIRADGSGFRTFTETVGGDGLYNEFGLSPDGSKAAYYNFEPEVVPGRGMHTHVVDLTTGQDMRLMFDPAATDEGLPEFLPDGRILTRVDGRPDGLAALLVGPADGNGRGTQIGPAFDKQARVMWLSRRMATSVLLYVDGQGTKLISIAKAMWSIPMLKSQQGGAGSAGPRRVRQTASASEGAGPAGALARVIGLRQSTP